MTISSTLVPNIRNDRSHSHTGRAAHMGGLFNPKLPTYASVLYLNSVKFMAFVRFSYKNGYHNDHLHKTKENLSVVLLKRNESRRDDFFRSNNNHNSA